MSMKRTLKYLEQSYKLGQKLGLETMKALLELLDNPQDQVKIIHVAGTNGKGSTCAMLTSILTEAGFKTGFYSSPHLISYRERMRIGDQLISEEDFSSAIHQVKVASDGLVEQKRPHPTEFEILTAAAYLYFREQRCDFALMEVGLGGRLDATNALDQPFLSVITPVGIDHEEFLGSTLSEIAPEKAGIIKQGRPVVLALQEEEALSVLLKDAQKKEARTYVVSSSDLEDIQMESQYSQFKYRGEDYEIPFIAAYQVRNASTALLAVEALRDLGIEISQSVVKEGLKKTRWSGRFEILQKDPLIIIDGAHNPQGVAAFSEAMKQLVCKDGCVGLLAVKEGKDYEDMLKTVKAYFTDIVITRPTWIKGVEPEELARHLQGVKTYLRDDISEAVALARKVAGSRPLISFGSLYLIGEVKRIIEDENHSGIAIS